MTRNFLSMDEKADKFYTRIMSNVLLNIYAVRNGLFDTLICETDDPTFSLRWRDAVPFVVEHMRSKSFRNRE